MMGARIRIRAWGLAAACIAGLVSPLGSAGIETGSERSLLNVVIILADDLGWRDLGCCGSRFYETPAIDRLALQGMRFTQAYAAANVCSPTRAALMTGCYPARLHTTNFFGGNRRGRLLPPEYRQSLPAETLTIAEALRGRGYRTAIAGKWHLGGRGSLPQDHGFEVVIGSECAPGRGPVDDPHFATMLSTKASEFIEQSKDRPFFLYLALHSVHVQLKTRPELKQKYQAKAAALPPSPGPREVSVGDHRARAVQDHTVYAGMIQEMDEAVGRVLSRIDELKLADRTVVVFTSDNGGLSTAEGSPTSNLPLRGGKGWNCEGGIRVPLIVRLPGRVAAGSTCDVPAITNDLYPTLMALANLPMVSGYEVDGVDLGPLLERRGSLAERPLFWHYPHYSNQGGRPGGAVRAGDYKLLESFEDGRVVLYDLSKDAGEEHDLAATQPERANEMKKLLADWRKSVGAQMPTPNPEPVEPFGPRGSPRVSASRASG
ncbi:MAG TPA: sulfatase [Phycisphaerae bacterium]|nr:sulfatase [Phycisphaerae bacterium]HRY68251.1 sulfatase [Phycisphaerae bacterium]HSA29948.1 sulfatase [Phycisphaerae bacterium]